MVEPTFPDDAERSLVGSARGAANVFERQRGRGGAREVEGDQAQEGGVGEQVGVRGTVVCAVALLV